MIEIRDMTVRRNGTVICRVEQLTIDPGQRVAVVGANGTGKTTLLRALAGLEPAVSGQCEVHATRRQRVFVHQNPYLFRGTALYNVMYGLRAQGHNRTTAEAAARGWMDKLGIGGFASRRVDTLSGGERRRVTLARALALEPKVLLLDEPLAELDEAGAEAIRAGLTSLNNTTVLITSPTDLPPDLVMDTYRIGVTENRPLHVG